MQVGQLTIPGFTYPVRELYLEDIFEMTGYVVGRKSRWVPLFDFVCVPWCGRWPSDSPSALAQHRFFMHA